MSTNGDGGAYPNRFKKGDRSKAGPGRPVGFKHVHTKILQDALLLAAEYEGDQDLYEASLKDKRVRRHLQQKYDEFTAAAEKRHGLVGYLRWVAREFPAVFCGLLAKLLPLQIRSDLSNEVVYQTVDDIQRDIKARKLPLERIAPLLLENMNLDKTEESDDE
jgi:hypothetical protein